MQASAGDQVWHALKLDSYLDYTFNKKDGVESKGDSRWVSGFPSREHLKNYIYGNQRYGLKACSEEYYKALKPYLNEDQNKKVLF